MKFFTTEWWQGGCEEASEIFDRYQAHFLRIRDHLPPSLVDLEENHTLHDAQIQQIVNDFGASSVFMELKGWDQALEHRVKYKLNFKGVSQFVQVLPREDYSDSELGDLGYMEIELVASKIEMRMLFASSAEFTIVFKDSFIAALT